MLAVLHIQIRHDGSSPYRKYKIYHSLPKTKAVDIVVDEIQKLLRSYDETVDVDAVRDFFLAEKPIWVWEWERKGNGDYFHIWPNFEQGVIEFDVDLDKATDYRDVVKKYHKLKGALKELSRTNN